MPSYTDVGLSDEEAAYQLAHLDDTKGPSLIAAAVILALLSTIAVAVRLAIRWRTKVGWKADDYLIVVAGVCRRSASWGAGAEAGIALVLGRRRVYIFWSVGTTRGRGRCDADGDRNA
jgi:hypothetical protein